MLHRCRGEEPVELSRRNNSSRPHTLGVRLIQTMCWLYSVSKHSFYASVRLRNISIHTLGCVLMYDLLYTLYVYYDHHC